MRKIEKSASKMVRDFGGVEETNVSERTRRISGATRAFRARFIIHGGKPEGKNEKRRREGGNFGNVSADTIGRGQTHSQ